MPLDSNMATRSVIYFVRLVVSRLYVRAKPPSPPSRLYATVDASPWRIRSSAIMEAGDPSGAWTHQFRFIFMP